MRTCIVTLSLITGVFLCGVSADSLSATELSGIDGFALENGDSNGDLDRDLSLSAKLASADPSQGLLAASDLVHGQANPGVLLVVDRRVVLVLHDHQRERRARPVVLEPLHRDVARLE